MYRQRTTTAHNQHVWILFSALALCTVVLWSLLGSRSAEARGFRSAEARTVWQQPQPYLRGGFPPPAFAAHPVLTLSRSGVPGGRFPGFPPTPARFIPYRPMPVSEARPAHVTASLVQMTAIFSLVTLSEDEGQLWFENAHAGLFGNARALPKFPPSRMFKVRRLVPPPDDFRFRLRLFRPGPAAEVSQEKRVMPDYVAAVQMQMAAQQPFHARQHLLPAQFQLPQDRLQHLRVLRL